MKKTRILSAILSAILAFTTVPMAALPVFAATPELGEELLTDGEWEGATNVKVPDYISVTGIPYSKSLQYFLKLDEGTKLETGDYTVSFKVRSTSEEVAYSDFVRVSGLGKWAGAATYRISDGEGGKINENETYTMTVALRGKTGNEVVQVKLRNADNASNNNFSSDMCIPNETEGQQWRHELHLTTEWQTFTIENLRFNDSYQNNGTDYSIWIEFYNSSNYDTFDIADISLVGSASGEVCENRNSAVDGGNGWDVKNFITFLEDVTRTDKLYFSLRDFGPEFSTATRNSTKDIILTENWQTFTADFEVVEDSSYSAGMTLTPSWQGAGSNYNVWIPFQNLSRVGTDEAAVSFDIKVFALVHNESGKNYIAGNEYKLTGLYDETASGWQAPNSGGEREVVNKTVTGFTNAYTYTYDDSKAITAGEYKLTAELTATEATQVEAVITYSDYTEVTAESQTVTTNTDTVIYTIEAEAGDVESVALRQVDGDAVIRFGEISLIQTSETEDPDNGGDEGEDPVNPNPNPGDDEEEDDEDDIPTDAVVIFEIDADSYYNVGDTIVADIVATASEDIDVYSINFELVVPEDLELESFTASAATEGATIKGDKFAWAYKASADNKLEITTDGVVVATAEFTIAVDPTKDTAKLTVDPEPVGLSNGKVEAESTVMSTRVTLYDIEITVSGANTTLAEGVDLYAKYNESDLYTNEARTEEDKYDLATELVANEGFAITGYEFEGEKIGLDELATYKFTESGTLTAITTAEITVTFVDGVNGSVTGEDKELVLLPGQTLKEILEENGIGYDADDNYEFVCWVDGDGNEIKVTDKINSSITIKPSFTGVDVKVTPAYLNFFKKSEAIEANTVTVTKAQFANNLQVTVADIDGYFLEKVTYTQGGVETEMAALSTEGAYASLTALNSASDITVTAYYSKLVTVEFFAEDDIATLNGQTKFYAKQYEGKLYTDAACETLATEDDIPTFTYLTNEDEGYQSVEMAGEDKWLIGEDDYADADLLTFVYDEDTTIEPNSDTEYRVTFTYTPGGVITGLNGATADVVFWAKKGTAMSTIAVPEINTVNDAQYETEFTDLADEVSGAVTYKAAATPKSYDVTLENTDGMLEIDVNKGTYSEDLEFTVSINAASEKKGYIAPTTVSYKVGNGEAVELTAVDGVFTITGDKITDVITVSAAAVKDTFTLTVPAGVKVNDVAEGTVQYQVGDTVEIEVAEGTLVTGITYTVEGVEGTNVAAYADGKYTLDATKLVGDVTVTVNTLDVTFDYITADDYKALAADTKILLVKGAGAEKVVALADEIDVFWSAEYEAHVAIVDAEASANDLANGMTVTAGTPDAIAYNGDVNASGATLAADAAYVSYMLHNNNAAFDDIERFEADFNGDGKVSTEDCQAILNVYLDVQQGN